MAAISTGRITNASWQLLTHRRSAAALLAHSLYYRPPVSIVLLTFVLLLLYLGEPSDDWQGKDNLGCDAVRRERWLGSTEMVFPRGIPSETTLAHVPPISRRGCKSLPD